MVPNQLSQLYAKGCGISEVGFQASKFILDGYRPIFEGSKTLVVHPRTSAFSLERNTPIELLSQVIKDFESKGIKCFVVPDNEDLRGEFLWADVPCEVLKEAGSSLEYRLAVAELATINFTWAAGISNVFHFSDVNFVQFGLLNDKSDIQTPDFYKRKGPSMGLQPSWFGRNQIFDWTPVANLTIDYITEKLMMSIEHLEEKWNI